MRREIRSHTGLRGIAALLVVGYHQQFIAGYKLPFERALFGHAYLMVDLFFILSGFVMSYVYEDMSDVRSFYRARFARIYPLHVFALLCLTCVSLGTVTLAIARGKAPPDLGSVGDWLRQLVLLNSWIPAKMAWNVPSWSISAEAFAYLLFPLVRSPSAYARLAIMCFSLAVYGYVIATTGSLDITVGLAPLRCLAGFGLGMLVYHHREVQAPILQFAAASWIAGMLIHPVSDPLIIPAFALLVLLTWQDAGPVAKMLSARPLHWLGEVSYSVYLMHVPVGAGLWVVWSHVHPSPVTRSLWLFIVYGCVIGTASITHRYIEKPAQAFLRSTRARRLVQPMSAP